MKKLLFLSLFSLCVFARESFIIRPSATFTFVDHSMYPTSKSFEHFGLYEYNASEGKHLRIGQVDKTVALGGYILSHDNKPVGSIYPELFSRGYFSTSWRNYFVYDEHDEILGHIQGIYDTGAAAEYIFFDKDETPFAKAILKTYLYNGVPLSLEFFDMEGNQLYEVKRISNLFKYSTLEYYWQLTKTDKEKAIDRLFLLPFVSAIMDVWW